MNIVETDGVKYVTLEDFLDLEREHEDLENAHEDKCDECEKLEEKLNKISDAVESLWEMV
jgi:hypothetical protein